MKNSKENKNGFSIFMSLLFTLTQNIYNLNVCNKRKERRNHKEKVELCRKKRKKRIYNKIFTSKFWKKKKKRFVNIFPLFPLVSITNTFLFFLSLWHLFMGLVKWRQFEMCLNARYQYHHLESHIILCIFRYRVKDKRKKGHFQIFFFFVLLLLFFNVAHDFVFVYHLENICVSVLRD